MLVRLGTDMYTINSFTPAATAVLLAARQVANAESVLAVHHDRKQGSSRALRMVSVLNLYIQNSQGQVCDNYQEKLEAALCKHCKV